MIPLNLSIAVLGGLSGADILIDISQGQVHRDVWIKITRPTAWI